jgi:hypothetical protein
MFDCVAHKCFTIDFVVEMRTAVVIPKIGKDELRI